MWLALLGYDSPLVKCRAGEYNPTTGQNTSFEISTTVPIRLLVLLWPFNAHLGY